MGLSRILLFYEGEVMSYHMCNGHWCVGGPRCNRLTPEEREARDNPPSVYFWDRENVSEAHELDEESIRGGCRAIVRTSLALRDSQQD